MAATALSGPVAGQEADGLRGSFAAGAARGAPAAEEAFTGAVPQASRTATVRAPTRLVKPRRVSRIGDRPRSTPTAPAAAAAEETTRTISEPLDAPEAVVERAPPRPDEDPFGPLGIRAGSFLLKPSIEVDFGFDDNPDRRSGGGDGAGFATLRPALAFESDWTRHALTGTIGGTYTTFLSGGTDDRPGLSGTVDGRFDVSRDVSIEAGLRGAYTTERIDVVSTPAATASRSPVIAYGATLGMNARMGRLTLGLRGTADRSTFEDVPLFGGGVQAAADRNLTSYGVTARASYEVSGAVSTFAEIFSDQRRYDNEATLRGSDGVGGRVGLALAPGGPLSGEVSIGYGARDYDDPTLPAIDGLLANASLVWQPTGLTSVRLSGSTEFAETTAAGSPGSITRSVGVDVTHAFRRHLVATVGVRHAVADFAGIERTDTTTSATTAVDYKLSRSVSIRGSLTHERFTSTVPGNDYTANTVFVGLRLQR